MPISRRLLMAASGGTLAGSGAGRASAAATGRFGYVCTYTADALPAGSGHGEGILQIRLDPASGHVTPVQAFAGPSPSWICFDAAGRHAYAVNEISSFENKPQGSVTAYAIDLTSGALRQLNVVSAGGVAPVYATVHPSGRFLLVANYGDGRIATLPIGADGSLGTPADVVAPQGTLGPTKAAGAPPGSFAVSGHTGSHAHMIAADPSGKWVLSTDLGFDRVYVWSMDPASGKLTAAPTPSFAATTAGAGPRHFAFGPGGNVLYVVFEEASQIASYRFDPATGGAAPVQTLSTLPSGFAGSSFASSIGLSPDGRFAYVGNRLHNSISVFALARDGRMRLVGNEWTRGDYPNQLALDPSGTTLLASNRRSDQVTVFRLDRANGLPRFTGQYLPVGSPNMVAFAPNAA